MVRVHREVFLDHTACCLGRPIVHLNHLLQVGEGHLGDHRDLEDLVAQEATAALVDQFVADCTVAGLR